MRQIVSPLDGFGSPFGQRSGGGSAPVVATSASILSQPLVGTVVELSEATVTGATSTSYQWYEGDPEDSGTTITGATSAGFTPTSAEYGSVLYRRATYTNAAGSTVEDIAAPAMTGAVFSEDFSGFTSGDTITEILAAGWTRASETANQNLWTASIVTDSGGPSGKAISFGTVSTVSVIGFRNDTDSFFGANSWQDYYEELFLVKHETNSHRIALRGKRTSANTNIAYANLGPGLNIRLNAPYLALPGEDFNAQPGTALTSWTAQYYWVRQRFQGNTLRVKVWVKDTPEPTDWTADRVHTETLTARGPALGAYISGVNRVVNYFSCGGNAPAPFWPGFIPPVAAFSDSYDFAAASSGATTSRYDGAIVLTMEDM